MSHPDFAKNFISVWALQLISKSYARLNQCSTFTGRILSIPLAIVDIFLGVLILLCISIEHFIRSIVNLVSAPLFWKDYPIKRSLEHGENAIAAALYVVNIWVIAFIKLTYQVLHIVFDPKQATPSFALCREVVKNCTLSPKMEEWQEGLFLKMQSKKVGISLLIRIFSPAISLFDGIMDVVRNTIKSYEHAARSLIHLVGACFFPKRCSLRKALGHLEISLYSGVRAGACILMLPFKFIYLTLVILWDPSTAKRFGKPCGKRKKAFLQQFSSYQAA
jgi:hypothetical protein